MNKHTPGPWKLCYHLQSAEKDKKCTCGFPGQIWGVDGECVVVGIGPHCPPEGQEGMNPGRYDRATEHANARLIAAAPEMLDLLKRLYALNGYVEAADLIAKAEGRNS